MNNFDNSFLTKEFGRDSKLFKNLYSDLESLFEEFKSSLFNIKSFKLFMDQEQLKNQHNYLEIIYLHLVIETILKKVKISISRKKNAQNIENLFSILFNDHDIFFLDLFPNKKENFDFFKSKKIISFVSLIEDSLKEKEFLIGGHDVFGDLYQNLLKKDSRHESGEFYTPNWLINQILDEIWDDSLKIIKKNKKIKILDPACGSGGFLIEFASRLLHKGIFTTTQEIINSIYGFDINEMSLFMTKANFFLFLTENLEISFNNNIESLNSPFRNIDTLLQKKKLSSLENYLDPIKSVNFKSNFDVVIGNPPWVTLRSITDENYQKLIKNEYFSYKLIQKSDTHLFTQLELASLFYFKSIDLYLKENGVIAFVMPKSVILGTKHNEEFRKFKNPQSKLFKIWNVENKKNLFGMPTCILFGKKGPETTYPVDMYLIKEINDLQIQRINTVDKSSIIVSYYPPETRRNKSFYYNKFNVGPSIFPRNLYFIDIINDQGEFLQVKTDPEMNQLAKHQWKNISLEGIVAKKFFYSTLLAWELVPFGYIRLRRIILPITINEKGEIQLPMKENIDTISKIWFDKTNEYWISLNTEKSKKRFSNLFERLNYNNLLLKQELKKFIVLYSGTGTNISCCVITRPEFKMKNLQEEEFIPDVKTWVFETNVEEEAHYLCAILNSEIINNLIKPLQPQGLGGGRAIHRRPLEFPINEFNKLDEKHVSLALLSLKSHEKLKINITKGLIKTRKQARELLKDELTEINIISELILNTQENRNV